MNEVKTQGRAAEPPGGQAEGARAHAAGGTVDGRVVAMARTELQTGFMCAHVALDRRPGYF
jgi:hypothetical protein